MEKNFEEQVNEYEKLIKANPNDSELLRQYGNYLTNIQKHSLAIEIFERALNINPIKINILKNYITTLIQAGEQKKANIELENILHKTPENFHHILNIYCNNILQNIKDIQVLKKSDYLLKEYPDNSRVLATVGEVLFFQMRYNEALEKFEKALVSAPSSILRKILINIGKTLLKLERYTEAFQKFDEVLKIKPTSSLFDFYRDVLIELERFEELKKLEEENKFAREKFFLQKGNKKIFNNTQLYLKYKNKSQERVLCDDGYFFYNLKEYEKAVDKFESALDLDKNNMRALKGYGYTLSKLLRYEEAIEVFYDVLEIDPNSISIMNSLGTILSKNNSSIKAFVVFEKSLELNLNDVVTLNSYAIARARNSQYDKAYSLFKKSLELNPNNSATLNSYAKVLSWDDKHDNAYELYKKLMLENPYDTKVIVSYSNALVRGNQYIEAMELVISSFIQKGLKNFLLLRMVKSCFLNHQYNLMLEILENVENTSSKNEFLKNAIAKDLSSNSQKISKYLDEMIDILDTRYKEDIAHLLPSDKFYELYNNKELESKLQEEKELNSTIFHKLENHINLIRLTFDLVIKKNYSNESTKIAEELKERTTTIFKKIKIMREEQKKLDDEIGESLEEIEKKLNIIGEDIADKINNELSLLRVKIDLAQKKDLISEKIFAKLKKQISTSSSIADNLRIINKPTNIVISNFKIKDIFENIEDKMTLENATISLDIKNEENNFETDKNRVKEIISELIENSIRHNSNRKLQIYILSANRRDPRINGIKHDGKYLYIKFKDNGIGVEEDKKEWIFLATKTTSSEGSGLGLYIIRKTIKSMNGFIIENGTYEKGVQFEIFIPYKK